MSYLGNAPALAYTSFAKQDFTVTATTSYSLDHPVANANEIALFINFVRQEPTASYSASGTTLTLTEATSVGDDMYCVFLGKAVQTVNPPNSSVGTSQLADNGVTTAKIVNDAVTKDKLLSHNYPAFESYVNDSVNVTSNTNTKVQANTEVFDTDSCYDHTTNYRFTPNVAGKYFVYAKGRGDASGTNNVLRVISIIFKNGAELINSPQYGNISNPHNFFTPFVAGVVDMNGSSDYVEFYINVLVDSGTPDYFGNANLRTTSFGAFRIGD